MRVLLLTLLLLEFSCSSSLSRLSNRNCKKTINYTFPVVVLKDSAINQILDSAITISKKCFSKNDLYSPHFEISKWSEGDSVFYCMRGCTDFLNKDTALSQIRGVMIYKNSYFFFHRNEKGLTYPLDSSDIFLITNKNEGYIRRINLCDIAPWEEEFFIYFHHIKGTEEIIIEKTQMCPCPKSSCGW